MSTTAAPSGSRGAAAYVLPLYTLTLFLSAFLLFAVQPMFTKMVLPLLGGSAAVWNTAVVFFQGTLLLGYLYAHLSTRLLGLRPQTVLHALVLLVSFAMLPIGLATGWTPPSEGLQIPWLMGLLAASIGLPFFAVSATAPLLQKWFAHTEHPAAGDPYFLYGGSNLGSLAALLLYPFLIEPALGLRAQGLAWTFGYAGLVAAIGTCAVILLRRFRAQEALSAAPEQARLVTHVTWRLRGRWFALSVVPSALLLGVTLHIGTDIAAAPFLWVLPLALYLFTFVLVFARRPLLSRQWALGLQLVSVALVALYFRTPDLRVLLVLHIGAMFFTAMVCHGELARLRPAASHLTEFYLWMSIGGVVGGFLAGIVAPLVFDGVYEYPLALLLGLLLRPLPRKGGWLTALLERSIGRAPGAALAGWWALEIALPLLVWFGSRAPDEAERLLRSRSFFGVYTVNAYQNPLGRFHMLMNGATNHGGQNLDRPLGPITYYFREGPVGQFFDIVKDWPTPGRRFGVIGLGVGGLACYLAHGQRMTYYEIDPLDERIAREPRYFTYLTNAGDKVDVVIGDGRLSLAKEPDGALDVIIVDAFSGDAIPAHLLTREALALYFQKLSAHGLLLLHVTNAYLDLMPVVASLVADAGLAARYSKGVLPTITPGASEADWVVVAKTSELLARFAWIAPPWPVLEPTPGVDLWTDDFTNVVQVLRWSGLGDVNE